MNTVKFEKGNVKIIAHRGMSGLETENSNAAFVAAGNRSYYGIECDIHVTADGKFVIIHDDDTGRVAKKDINVESSTYAELRKIKLNNMCKNDVEDLCKNVPRGDLIIPSLEEYVGICKKYEKQCVIELKNRFEREDAKRVIAEIEKMDYLDNVIFISFSFENMVMLRELLPDIRLQYLVVSYDKDILKKMNKYNLDIDIHYRGLTKEIIDEVHVNKHCVNCWTCDNVENAQRLAAWGVDFITTNILE